MLTIQSRRHRGRGRGRGACHPPTSLFCVAKRKKGDKGKKERISKQKLLKGCHQGQNIIVLAILECLEYENFYNRISVRVLLRVVEQLNTWNLRKLEYFKKIPKMFEIKTKFPADHPK